MIDQVSVDPVHAWVQYETAFTEEECERIIQIGTSNELQQGKIFNASNEEDMVELRKAEGACLYPSEELNWVHVKIQNIVTQLNDKFFMFNLLGAFEGLQFIKYSAPGGKYGRHLDSSTGNIVRKLSFTLQLSKEESYEGGELCLHVSDKPKIASKKQGCIVLFPSYILHEVTPVTRGTRYSLVSWFTGRPFT
jgi:PKHD-type hydroxylase